MFLDLELILQHYLLIYSNHHSNSFNMRIFTSVSFLLTFCSCLCFAQTDSVVTVREKLLTPVPTELQYPVSLYKEATFESQNLNNGRVYYIYDSRMKEHQFFDNRKWDKGAVIFEGQRFDSVAMMYDIVKDELVIRHINGDAIILPSEKVEAFSNYGQLFKWYESGKGIDAQMRTGFYNVFYDGPSRLLIRRSKVRQEKIVDRQVITIFPQKDFHYVRKGNQYHFVRTKKSVLKLFPDHKREMRRVLREENIHFRSERTTAIGRMVATYDAVTKL